MNKFHEYEPQPSEKLKEYGELLSNSYFLATGTIYSKKRFGLSCKFEIAHMQQGDSYAVVYFVFPEFSTYDDREKYERLVHEATWLEGTEIFNGRTIVAKVGYRKFQIGDHASRGLQIVYYIDEYSAKFQPAEESVAERENSVFRFYLANLPLRLKYSSEFIRRNRKETAERKRLEAIIDKAIEVKDQEIEEDELKTILLETADNAGKITNRAGQEELANRDCIALEYNGVEIAKIYWISNYEERAYNSCPVAMLRIDENSLPPGWKARDLSEWICKFLSIAIGKDVNWNIYRKLQVQPGIYNEIVWVSRKIEEKRFNAFTIKYGYFREALGVDKEDDAVAFVEAMFAFIFKYDSETTLHFLNAAFDYVRYMSIPTRNPQVTSNLLCALGEFVYRVWENIYQDHSSISKLQSASDLKKSLLKIVDDFDGGLIIQEENEPQEMYLKRLDKYKNTLKSKLGNLFGISLFDKYAMMFEAQGWLLDRSEKDGLAARIEQFVNSRNKLFHEHRFAKWGEEDNSLSCEIDNIEMMIPLMIAAIVNYEGKFWDVYLNSWNHKSGSM